MEIINRHTAGFVSSVDQGMITSDGQSLPYNRVTVRTNIRAKLEGE